MTGSMTWARGVAMCVRVSSCWVDTTSTWTAALGGGESPESYRGAQPRRRCPVCRDRVRRLARRCANRIGAGMRSGVSEERGQT